MVKEKTVFKQHVVSWSPDSQSDKKKWLREKMVQALKGTQDSLCVVPLALLEMLAAVRGQEGHTGWHHWEKETYETYNTTWQWGMRKEWEKQLCNTKVRGDGGRGATRAHIPQ